MNALSETRYCGARLQKRDLHILIFSPARQMSDRRSSPAQLSYSIVTKRKICSHILFETAQVAVVAMGVLIDQKEKLYENTKLRFGIVTAADPVHKKFR